MSSNHLYKQRGGRTFARTAVLAVVTGALLAMPAGASAHLQATVETVKAHTDRADRGLDRAVAMFDRSRDRRAARAFNRSRREMGLATAEAAKLRRGAESDSDRADAALARQAVAEQQDANVERLVGLLDEASGRVENKIAKAALADTRGRDKAVSILTALLEQVPAEAQEGIANAIAALSGGRSSEVRAEARALGSGDVSNRNKRRVAKAVESSVEGQHGAAETLGELIASEEMPAASKEGLQRAYDAVTREQERTAKILSRFSDRMPASIRAFVEQVVQQAQDNAQGMRDNRPPPPSGQPEGAGPPEAASTGPSSS